MALMIWNPDSSPVASRGAEIREAIGQLKQQQARGLRWMLQHIAADGEPAGAMRFNSYYRVPWTLAICGEREAAASVLSWVERHALDANGNLRAGAAERPNAPYSLAQLAIGAAHLERYDTARRLMDVLAGYQDPLSGGCYTERPGQRLTFRQDVLVTCQLGLAALTTGRRTVADAAYQWLERLLQAQPDLPARLFTGWGPQGLLEDRTHEAAWAAVTDFHEPRQQFYNPGMAAAFAGRYHMATGDAGALEVARSFLKLSAQGDAMQWDGQTVQICKFGWGAAVLLEATQEPLFLDYALRMVRWFGDMQGIGGNWHASPFQVPQPTPADDMPKTAEHTLHVTTLLTALSSVQHGGRTGPPD